MFSLQGDLAGEASSESQRKIVKLLHVSSQQAGLGLHQAGLRC